MLAGGVPTRAGPGRALRSVAARAIHWEDKVHMDLHSHLRPDRPSPGIPWTTLAGWPLTLE